jgi:hypothetical protein
MSCITFGLQPDLSMQIKGPDGRIIYNAERQTEGKYSFVAHESGLYSFCFRYSIFCKENTLHKMRLAYVVW